MTPWLGRCGFGDAPTIAIVRALARISAGLLATLQGYPSAHGRQLARRGRPARLDAPQGGQPRARRAPGGPRGLDRSRPRASAGEVERHRLDPDAPGEPPAARPPA